MPPRPDAGPELLDRLQTLMHRYKRHMHLAMRDDPEGLSPMEARALSFYARHPGGSAGELVEHSGRDKAQIARLVQALQQRGLIAGEVSAEDRRSQLWWLTERGREAQRRIAGHRRRFERALLAGLDPREADVLDGLLARLVDATERP